MDPTAMDDKLYYVESPDGQVLGPMTMMQILEGIAAAAILESARICEVGGQEWVLLSDVAYTRDDLLPDAAIGAATVPEPVAEVAPAPVPAPEAVEGPAWAEPVEEIPVAEAPADPAPAETWNPTPATAPAAEAPAAEAARAAMDVAMSAGPPAEPPQDGAGDFALELDESAESASEEEYAPEPSKGGRRWIVPVAIAAAIPIVIGVYLLAGGEIPFALGPGAGSPSPASEIVPPPAGPADPVETAWAQLRAGDTATAAAAFRAALAEDPANVAARHGLGRCALRDGDARLAIGLLGETLEIAPNDADVRLDLARARLAAGEYDAAVAEATRVRELDPGSAQALLVRARAHEAAGDVEGHLRDLGAYIEAAPKDADAHLELARGLAASGRLEPAIDELNVYLQARPGDRESQLARLEWMRTVGRTAEAAVLYAKLADEAPKDAERQYLAALAQRDDEEAMRRAQRALTLEPGHADARALLARLRAAHPRPVAPPPVATRPATPKPAPGDLDVAGTGTPPADAGRTDDGETLAAASPPPVRGVRPAAPKPEPVAPAVTPLADRIAAVRKALDAEDYPAARKEIEVARAELSGDATAMRNLGLWEGIVAYEEGEFDDAVTAFEKLDASASYEASGWGAGCVPNWLARTHLARGDVRSVVAVLDQVGPSDPDEYATARLWEGVALSSLGMTDLAERTWSRISIDVGSGLGPQGRAALQTAEFLTGSLSQKDYATAVAPVPDFENDMHWFLAWVAARDDRPDEARTEWSRAVSSSKGRDFPWHLAQAEISGSGLATGDR